MPMLKPVHEHDVMEELGSFDEKLKWDGSPLPGSDRYFIKWEQTGKNKPTYKAYYVVGVQRIQTKSLGNIELAVLPKIKDIDFMKMFMDCFMNPDEHKSFHEIYDIDLDAEPIECEALESVLSPLLIVHYVNLVSKFLQKDLKKNYVDRSDNLNKVKGRIAISANLKANTIRGREHKIWCNYQEYTEDIVENRIIKKALLFSKGIAQGIQSSAADELIGTINICLSKMEKVSDEVMPCQVKSLRFNSIFSEYRQIVSLACTILRRYEFSLSQASAQNSKIPPFWIDMPLLFEHYIGGILAQSYPGDIIYQAKGKNEFPDFLSKTAQAILDAKYKPLLKFGNAGILDIIRQLAGYSRDRSILRQLRVNDETVVPCVFIYPDENADKENGEEIFSKPLKVYFDSEYEISGFTKFYKIGVGLPRLQKK